MYSLFSNTNNNYTLEENAYRMNLTAFQANALNVAQTFNRTYKYCEFGEHYYNNLKDQIKLDKALFLEYLQAKKKGKEEFMNVYETWKANSLLSDQFLYTTTSKNHTKPIDWDAFFMEGKAPSNEIPKFIKDIIWDFAIFSAFFIKFLRRASE